MATNGETFGRCASYLVESGKEYLICTGKHGEALSLSLELEQEHQRIISHIAQHLKWEGKFSPSPWHGNNLKTK